MIHEPIRKDYDINGHNVYVFECAGCGVEVIRRKSRTRGFVLCQKCRNQKRRYIENGVG